MRPGRIFRFGRSLRNFIMKKIKAVTIGGGTGQFTLLSGLAEFPLDLTAVVSMADDGGSTGRLRDELGVLPPGDVRQCLVALSEAPEILRKLMNYRFSAGDLSGHSFGNLFLSALEKVCGDFSRAVTEAAHILNVRGRVLPVSRESMSLEIFLRNGEVVRGQSKLDDCRRVREIGIAKIALAGRPSLNEEVLAVLAEADIIIIGPGDFFGSILPNLLLPSVGQAIADASAKVIFVAPLTAKKGQTVGWTLAEYVDYLEKFIAPGRVDAVLVNTAAPHPDLVARYEKQEGQGSVHDFSADEIAAEKIARDLLCSGAVRFDPADKLAGKRSFIRHDGRKLAAVAAEMMKLS